MTRTLDDGLLQAVSESIERQLGLHYPPERWADLERGLRGAAPELGFESVEKCARELVFAKLDRAQIDALAAHLTIGETYFFRDADLKVKPIWKSCVCHRYQQKVVYYKGKSLDAARISFMKNKNGLRADRIFHRRAHAVRQRQAQER